MKKLLLLPVFVLIALVAVSVSQANVLIEDVNSTQDADFNGGLLSGVIETGSGAPGDYELISCGIFADGNPNPFNAPSPGSWNEIVNETCFPDSCQLGIWSRFTDSSGSDDITCSWDTDNSSAFAAGSFRYNNVDKDNPIIDSACSEFDPLSQMYVTDPVQFEAGSQLVQILLISGGNQSGALSADPFSDGFTELVEVGPGLALTGISEFQDTAGTFQFPAFPRIGDTIALKFCAISLRMAPKVIPTMSEWGLIATAGVLGIISFFALRRRKAAA